jgi:transmembrane sensor
MDDNPYITSLLEKLYREGLSHAEKEALNAFIRTEEGERQLRAFMDEKAVEAFDESSPMAPGETSAIFNKLQTNIIQEGETRPRKDGGRLAFYQVSKIAASFIGVILLVFAGILAYEKHQTVAYSTDLGEKETILLPDLSTVTLHGNSSLTYKRNWEDGASREVDLHGEAYFSVTKSKDKPFIVHAGDIDVKVLGTTFTVRSYEEDESVETSLLEGSIAVRSRADLDADEIVLSPNQKATFLKSSQRITLSQVTPDLYTSSASSKLVFEDARFGEIVRSLERKYGVRIAVHDDASEACRFSATIHYESLKEVLDLFASTTDLSYRISGKAIEITGELCTTNP